ncbi:MAG: hypothetical protein ABSE49_29335 [Polyangiaceae bacterium]
MRTLRPYLLGVFLVAVVTAMKTLFAPLGHQVPFVLYFAAPLITALRDDSTNGYEPEQPGDRLAAVGIPLQALGLDELYAECACPEWNPPEA